MKKITLQVNGREMTFSEEELTSILERYYKITKQDTIQITQTPTEGKWFEVNPSDIDQNLFKEKRSDSKQEKTRLLITDAFEELKKHPERNKAFKTLIPEKIWLSSRTVLELEEKASQLGDHMADWVEQALEWAQRIANGESWVDICNKGDTAAKCYRLVIWKNGQARLVGGLCFCHNTYPASDFEDRGYNGCCDLDNAVPLVVL